MLLHSYSQLYVTLTAFLRLDTSYYYQHNCCHLFLSCGALSKCILKQPTVVNHLTCLSLRQVTLPPKFEHFTSDVNQSNKSHTRKFMSCIHELRAHSSAWLHTVFVYFFIYWRFLNWGGGGLLELGSYQQNDKFNWRSMGA